MAKNIGVGTIALLLLSFVLGTAIDDTQIFGTTALFNREAAQAGQLKDADAQNLCNNVEEYLNDDLTRLQKNQYGPKQRIKIACKMEIITPAAP